MLISMPTGTSTILGAFQAISALPDWLTGSVDGVSPSPHKVARGENFASEIFTLWRPGLPPIAAQKRRSPAVSRMGEQATHRRFREVEHGLFRLARGRRDTFADKNPE